MAANVQQVYEILVQTNAERVEQFAGSLNDVVKGVNQVSSALQGVGPAVLAGFQGSLAGIARFRSMLSETSAKASFAATELRALGQDTSGIDKAQRKLRELLAVFDNYKFSFSAKLTADLATVSTSLGKADKSATGVTNSFLRASEVAGKLSASLIVLAGAGGVAGPGKLFAGRIQETVGFTTAIQAAVASAQRLKGASIDARASVSELSRVLNTEEGAALARTKNGIEDYIVAWNQAQSVMRSSNTLLQENNNLMRAEKAATLVPRTIIKLMREQNITLEQRIRLENDLADALMRGDIHTKDAMDFARTRIGLYKAEELRLRSVEEASRAAAAAEADRKKAADQTKAIRDQERYRDAVKTVTQEMLKNETIQRKLVGTKINAHNIAVTVARDLANEKIGHQDVTRAIHAQIDAEAELAKLQEGDTRSSISNLGQIFLFDQMAKRLVGVLGEASRRFSEFEQKLTEVRKTANASTEAADALGNKLLNIGQVIPIAANDLGEIAAILGQIGALSFDPAKQSAEEFAEAAKEAVSLVAQVAIATDLSADEAAKSYGRLKAIFSNDVSRLRSELSALTGTAASTTDALRAIFGAFNQVSNSTTATVADTNELIQAFGGVASNVGITVEQVAALSGALGDLGVSQSVAGTALSRFFAEASKRAEVVAKLLGTSVDEFRASLDADAYGTFLTVLKKLKDSTVEQREAFLAGFAAEQRFRNTLLKLVQGVERLEGVTALATDTLANFSSIGNEAEKFSETFAAKIQKLSNGFTSLSTTFEPFFNNVGRLAGTLGEVLNAISGLLKASPALQSVVTNILGFGAAFLAGLTALAAFRASIALLTGKDSKNLRIVHDTISMFGDVLRLSGFAADKTKVQVDALGAEQVDLATKTDAATAALRRQKGALEQTALAARGAQGISRAPVGGSIAPASFGVITPGARSAMRDSGTPTKVIDATGRSAEAAAGSFDKLTSSVVGLGSAAIGVTSTLYGVGDLLEGNIATGLIETTVGVGSLVYSAGALKAALAGVTAAGVGTAAVVVAAAAALVALDGTVINAANRLFRYTESVEAVATGTEGVIAGTSRWLFDLVTLGSYVEEFQNDVIRMRETLVGNKRLELAEVSAFRQVAEAMGASSDQIEAWSTAIATGTKKAEEGFLALREAAEAAKRTGVVDLSIRLRTDVDPEQVKDILERNVLIATRGLSDFEIGVPAVVNGERLNEQELELERNKRATARANLEVERISRLILSAAGDSAELQEDYRKRIIASKGSLEALVQEAHKLNLATGYTLNTASGLPIVLDESTRAAAALAAVSADARAAVIEERDSRRRASENEAALVEHNISLKDVLARMDDKAKRSLEEQTALYQDLAKATAAYAENAKQARAAAVASLRDRTALFEQKEAALQVAEEEAKKLQDRATATGTREDQLAFESAAARAKTLRDQVDALAIAIDANREHLLNLGQDFQFMGKAASDAIRKVSEEMFEMERKSRDAAQKALSRFSVDAIKRVMALEREALRARMKDHTETADAIEAIEQDLAARIADIHAKKFQTLEQVERARLALVSLASARLLAALEDSYTRQFETLRKGAQDVVDSLQERKARSELKFETDTRPIQDAIKALTETQERAEKLKALFDSLKAVAPFSSIAESANKARASIISVAGALRELELRGADSSAGVLSGMDRIRQTSLSAGREIGRVAAEQQRLQDVLKDTANTVKGRYANEFLRTIKRIASDPALNEIKKGILLEETIAKFRAKFGTLSGEGPSEQDVLTLAEQLVASDGQRLRTAKDITREAEKQAAAAFEALNLSERDRKKVERLLDRRAQLMREEQSYSDRGLDSLAGITAGKRTDVEVQLESILKDKFADVVKPSGETLPDDIRAEQARLALIDNELRLAALTASHATEMRKLGDELILATDRVSRFEKALADFQSRMQQNTDAASVTPGGAASTALSRQGLSPNLLSKTDAALIDKELSRLSATITQSLGPSAELVRSSMDVVTEALNSQEAASRVLSNAAVDLGEQTRHQAQIIQGLVAGVRKDVADMKMLFGKAKHAANGSPVETR